MDLSRNQRTILMNQAFYSMYSSLTLSFIVPFALVLGASNVIVGVLNALQYIAIALAVIPGERVIEKLGRKVTYLTFIPIGRLLWIVMILLPFYFDSSLLVLLVFFFLINFFEYFVEPGYLSMMADVVPARIRGWFFGKRNMVRLFFDTILFFLAGFYLDLFPAHSALGFTNVMLAGLVFGLLGIVVISQLSVPNKPAVRTHEFRDYFRLSSNFKRFLLFAMSFNFAAMIASPFFTVYMLENLGLSYGVFVSATLVSVVFRMLAQHHLAPITDKVGDRTIAWLSTFGTVTAPLLMFFVTPDSLWLLWVAQAVSGFAWGGHDLAVFNMLLDVTNKRDRSFQMSAYVFFTAIPIALAPVLGGWMADNVVFVVAGIPLVFLVSAVLRAVTSLFMLNIPELRVREKYSVTYVLRQVVSIHPERGVKWVVRLLRNHDGGPGKE